MQFQLLLSQARAIRKKYAQWEETHLGQTWTKTQLVEGLVVDVGDLMKLVQAKEGLRDIKHVDEKLAHELIDCLWSVMVIADAYGVDLEKAFVREMDALEEKLSA
ncbi:MAG: nucleotide pyrophosphohydrolase [Pseudomonadales bacterium]|nr:nucleotide pyrophosphohydrolase [Candidatus Woesebacteria bacterium]MCB9802110.1 nucleotide pyrophosphohydrolase [Pseudomonadales bacterium]